MLKTFCFEVHASAISAFLVRFWENVKWSVFTFGTCLEDVEISGDITPRMRSARIYKMLPFLASDLQLANSWIGHTRNFVPTCIFEQLSQFQLSQYTIEIPYQSSNDLCSLIHLWSLWYHQCLPLLSCVFDWDCVFLKVLLKPGSH